MKVVFVLGAGATLSDVVGRPRKEQPPLDSGFFRIARVGHPNLTGEVAAYMKSVYDDDVYAPEFDSLERVMGQIYTDTFNEGLGDQARKVFRALLKLFNRRVADTTNNIGPTRQRWLYRMLAGFLAAGVLPGDITVITYNQDLQVEKTLCLLSERKKWQGLSPQIFNFPNCYCLGPHELTLPTRGNAELFDETEPVDGCIRVLKLHGSLNWFSTHTSPTPTQNAMFNPNRKLRITRRRIVSPSMTMTKKRATYALPIVVPPVTHKSSVLHNDLRPVWKAAEDALDEADELIVFGYSCPPLDLESANQLKRSQVKSEATVSVVDPNGQIAARYIDLLNPASLAFYKSAKVFMSSHPKLKPAKREDLDA